MKKTIYPDEQQKVRKMVNIHRKSLLPKGNWKWERPLKVKNQNWIITNLKC